MAKKHSTRLVIDASIAFAAGGEGATHPRSKHCRDFLKAVLEICHHVVVTPDISVEWKNNRSPFARKWQCQMYARKKVHSIALNIDKSLLDKLNQMEWSENERETILKDVLLIEAAIATDRTVASLDNEVRSLFAKASTRIAELKRIAWVNPEQSEEKPIEWLESGAKPEEKRFLQIFSVTLTIR